jgi:hypothetical protein
MELRKSRVSLALLFSLIALTVAAVSAPGANAVNISAAKVTGGKTEMSVPFSLLQQLGKDRIFVTPIAPATLSYPNFFPIVTFPVTGGKVETSTMLGTVNMLGGIKIYQIDPTYSTITKQLDVTDVRIVNGNTLAGNAIVPVPSPAADLVNATHTFDPVTGNLHYEADAQVGVATALVLNTYFNTYVFTPGLAMGHMTSDIQTNRILSVGAG